MDNITIIHAGPAAASLKMLVNALHSLGVREQYFMTDLIDTLSYDEEFDASLKEMTTELLYGQYLHYRLNPLLVDNFKAKDFTSEFLDITAKTSTNVARYLHTTLVTQNRYDANGKFPYEFHAFDGKLIFLTPVG